METTSAKPAGQVRSWRQIVVIGSCAIVGCGVLLRASNATPSIWSLILAPLALAYPAYAAYVAWNTRESAPLSTKRQSLFAIAATMLMVGTSILWALGRDRAIFFVLVLLPGVVCPAIFGTPLVGFQILFSPCSLIGWLAMIAVVSLGSAYCINRLLRRPLGGNETGHKSAAWLLFVLAFIHSVALLLL